MRNISRRKKALILGLVLFLSGPILALLGPIWSYDIAWAYVNSYSYLVTDVEGYRLIFHQAFLMVGCSLSLLSVLIILALITDYIRGQ